ncbi:MAG: hypothetical protein K5761_03560, partial [Clostridiales bacterium]|nr:hypothetical protein [Clostridiales bacterium]
MDNLKDNDYYVKTIKADLEFIVSHMNGLSIEEFAADEVLLDSMMFRMIQISENSRKLTDKYKAARSEVPWNSVYGM